MYYLQAQAMEDAGIKADKFLLLNVPDDVLIERCVGRRFSWCLSLSVVMSSWCFSLSRVTLVCAKLASFNLPGVLTNDVLCALPPLHRPQFVAVHTHTHTHTQR